MKPAKYWLEKERVGDEIVPCLTIILKTPGCKWARIEGCTMCGFQRDSDLDVSQRDIINQLVYALENQQEFNMIKIFTSGSFFDTMEISPKTREEIFRRLGGVKFVVVESRPEYISENVFENLDYDFQLQVAIGLETADDEIRLKSINKGFKFTDYRRAVRILKRENVGVKTYLLLKPPGLTERESIDDAVKSMEKIKKLTDIISLNPCNVQSGTVVERLWRSGLYRPPWLWSVVDVLKKGYEMGVDIISDPVGAGSPRGPHNCRKCSKDVAESIRLFSLQRNLSLLHEMENSCECYGIWKDVLTFEDHAGIMEV